MTATARPWCMVCGDTGRASPTLEEPDGRACDCLEERVVITIKANSSWAKVIIEGDGLIVHKVRAAVTRAVQANDYVSWVTKIGNSL